MTSTDESYKKLKKEYEDFVYIVSHDLQSPVRHIREFTTRFLNEAGENLTEKQVKYSDFLMRSVKRMERMQDALLQLSRVTTEGQDFEECPSQELIHKAIEPFKDIADISFLCDESPTLYCDPEQIHTLLTHIIQNAITFNDQENKKITIECKDQDKHIEIKITDNGIGIPPQFHDDIFLMFRRLHPVGEYGDGDGAGLTICKKIIERHSGEIFIESEEDHAATSAVLTIRKNH